MIPRSNFIRSFVLAIGVLAAAACAADVAAPPTDLSPGPFGTVTGSAIDATGMQFHALWWESDLKNPVSVSKTITAAGGTISIPETGLTVSFPAGAVAEPLTVTITADPRYVAYKMEPSGTQFLKDVTVTQLFDATQLSGAPLRSTIYAAYIADDNISLSGSVPAIEIEPSKTIFSATAPTVPEAQVWIIRHFSRYMLASG
ncbi:MAG TPA: hypothetical protein VFK26_01955 [Gemmatimonadaceae bacterium]|nr:hypothetical protein [Gemmatimonadaceae bacterium]